MIDTEKILGSLTAVGVTLLSAASAQAGEIYANTDVTDTSGVHSAAFTLALPGTNTFTINAATYAFGANQSKFERVISIKSVGTYGRIKTVDLGLRFSSVELAATGKFWGSVPGHTSHNGTLAGNTSARTHKAFPSGHYTDAYIPFEFKNTTEGGEMNYGWIQASLVHDGYTTLDVNIAEYAWEPDGAQLAMAATPSDVTPEPASASLGALAIGAMILGSAGVRRFKQARQKQETAA